jgi:hypothetical protein
MKNLNLILKDICTELNLPFGYDDAVNKNAEMYLYIEFASCYGGYRLVNVLIKNGGHCGAFGESSCCSRKSLKEMTNYLEGILYGIKYSKKSKL